MKVYIATDREDIVAAVGLHEKLRVMGFEPTSSWPHEEAPADRAVARITTEASDRQIADSAAMLVVGLSSFEAGIRFGQAIELGADVGHLPAVIVLPGDDSSAIPPDVHRSGVRFVGSVDAAIETLASWKKRLNTIPPKYQRQAIWTMLLSDDARAAG